MKNPLKLSGRTEFWPLLIVLFNIALSLWAYPRLPNRVITHWDFYGSANGWGSRDFHAIFFPALLIGLYFLFTFLPLVDPKRESYQEFSGVYLKIRNLILVVFSVIFAAATFANLGYPIAIGPIVAGAIGLLMIALGNYFRKLKRNWFIGIRTPWTLSSDNVWEKTHLLGGRLFMVWGLTLIFTPWLTPTVAGVVLLGGLVVMLVWIYVYSYIIFKKEKEANKGTNNETNNKGGGVL